MREAHRAHYSRGEAAPRCSRPHGRQAGGGLYGENPSAMVEDAGVGTAWPYRRAALHHGFLQLLAPRPDERAERSRMGRRRIDGYWLLSDFHFAVSVWIGAGARSGID